MQQSHFHLSERTIQFSLEILFRYVKIKHGSVWSTNQSSDPNIQDLIYRDLTHQKANLLLQQPCRRASVLRMSSQRNFPATSQPTAARRSSGGKRKAGFVEKGACSPGNSQSEENSDCDEHGQHRDVAEGIGDPRVDLPEGDGNNSCAEGEIET